MMFSNRHIFFFIMTVLLTGLFSTSCNKADSKIDEVAEQLRNQMPDVRQEVIRRDWETVRDGYWHVFEQQLIEKLNEAVEGADIGEYSNFSEFFCAAWDTSISESFVLVSNRRNYRTNKFRYEQSRAFYEDFLPVLKESCFNDELAEWSSAYSNLVDSLRNFIPTIREAEKRQFLRNIRDSVRRIFRSNIQDIADAVIAKRAKRYTLRIIFSPIIIRRPGANDTINNLSGRLQQDLDLSFGRSERNVQRVPSGLSDSLVFEIQKMQAGSDFDGQVIQLSGIRRKAVVVVGGYCDEVNGGLKLYTYMTHITHGTSIGINPDPVVVELEPLEQVIANSVEQAQIAQATAGSLAEVKRERRARWGRYSITTAKVLLGIVAVVVFIYLIYLSARGIASFVRRKRRKWERIRQARIERERRKREEREGKERELAEQVRKERERKKRERKKREQREREERAQREREEAERKEREAAEEERRRKTPGAIIEGPLPGMNFSYIPEGSFMMGSNDGDSEEKPVRRVTVPSFYMMTTTVTQKMWVEVMGGNPSNFQGNNLPVEKVSWNDVQEFIRKLNRRDPGNDYRLPSESEWEYACRAGTTTKYHSGNSESDLARVGWYNGNSDDRTHSVGQKSPNAWGLYDMHGNVWEWCEDWYHGNYNKAPTDGSVWISPSGSRRVLRGGCWNGSA
ncbi:MAG: formylglycine-generating enzyme family protein, partial [Candidatus Electryoneaceae bacterium]|nr:formylglycine-generating enzyme family protein [Candidatus Electryoneaceae bacterium]